MGAAGGITTLAITGAALVASIMTKNPYGAVGIGASAVTSSLINRYAKNGKKKAKKLINDLKREGITLERYPAIHTTRYNGLNIGTIETERYG